MIQEEMTNLATDNFAGREVGDIGKEFALIEN